MPEKSNQLTAPAPTPISAITPTIARGGLTLQAMKAQREELIQFVRSILIDGTDFGTIPGTEKATLFKPGAEKICMLYGLSPTIAYEKEIEQFDGDEPLFFYRIKCTLIHRASGHVAGEGVGSCSSRESKYRYRVEWWNERDEPPSGQGWQKKITRHGTKYLRRTPNPDAADQANTILKMAAKRAQIDATLRVTGSSELFMQDMEDLPEQDRPRESKRPPPDPRDISVDVAKIHDALRAKMRATKNMGELQALAAEIKKTPQCEALRAEYAEISEKHKAVAAQSAHEGSQVTKEPATGVATTAPAPAREPGDDTEEDDELFDDLRGDDGDTEHEDPGPPDDVPLTPAPPAPAATKPTKKAKG